MSFKPDIYGRRNLQIYTMYGIRVRSVSKPDKERVRESLHHHEYWDKKNTSDKLTLTVSRTTNVT